MAHILFIACCIGVALTLLPIPYSFYILLRILFFVSMIYYAIVLYKGKANNIMIVLIGFAILYNPFITVNLGTKSLWLIVNIATLVFMYSIKDTISKKRF